MKLLKGSIIHAPALETLETIENGALLLDDDGTIREVLHEAPADFDGLSSATLPFATTVRIGISKWMRITSPFLMFLTGR